MTFSLVAGHDASHYQHAADDQHAFSWGSRFAWFKASQGGSSRDARLGEHHDAAQALGIAAGPYHFYDNSASPQQNAANFLAATAGRTWQLPHALDYENASGRVSADDLLTFLNIVEQATGRTPVLYTGPAWWSSVIGNDARFARFPLWLAHYPSAYDHPDPPLPPDLGTTVAPWPATTVWQFSSAGGIDRNATTTDNLAALTGTAPNPEEFTMDQEAKDAFKLLAQQIADLRTDVDARFVGLDERADATNQKLDRLANTVAPAAK